MQPTKDSFYIALRDRLAALNPARVISLGGQQRPAILVPENEVRTALSAPAPFDSAGATPAGTKTRLPDCFYLQFGAITHVRPAAAQPVHAQPLMKMACAIVYATCGTPASTGAGFGGSPASPILAGGGQDRGRALAELDRELLAICSPALAPKLDFTQSPPAPRGTNIAWSAPDLGPPLSLGLELRRTAQLSIFFYPELSL